jgi:hypothetical protein
MLISKLDYIAIPEKSKLTDGSPRFTDGMKMLIFCNGFCRNIGIGGYEKEGRPKSEVGRQIYKDGSPKSEENMSFILLLTSDF